MRCILATALIVTVLTPSAALAQAASWLVPQLHAAAKAEGGLTVYSSINEQEALPLWKLFEDVSGIPVAFIRASDVQLTARITIEARAGKPVWDLLQTATVTRLPAQMRRAFSPPEATALTDAARGPDKRWYGAAANYNAPAYNTQFIKKSELPKTVEDFIAKKEWKGRVAIDSAEFHWLRALVLHFGEKRGRELAHRFFEALDPVLIDGHLALARAIASGEYWVTPSNFIAATNNQMISGAPIDYWGIQPMSVFFSQVAVSANAPHPNAGELAANFLLSREAQHFLTRMGRVPTRLDVHPNPADAVLKLGDVRIIPLEFGPEEERYWQKEFQGLIRPK